MRNRYYDSSIGRFITEDPAQAGVNWYVYCENNPVMYTDPWGLWESGDEKYPLFIQKAINTYTEEYWEAQSRGDKYGMEAAHAKAESARALAESFVTREEWGAVGDEDKWGADPDKDTIVIHHTNNNDSISEIEAAHIKKDYGTVGYHFVIGKDGTVYEGTPLENKGAHVGGANTGKIGISLIGNFEGWYGIGTETPGTEQLISMGRLITVLQDSGAVSTAEVKGHRDYNSDTVCPGQNLYNIIKQLY